MSKEEFLKIKKCVLKVNIHCDGCKQKVKKILQKIDGVFTIEIDAEAGKVTVSGNVEPGILIKKLSKSKKYAQIWGLNPNTINEMKNLVIENGKGGDNQLNGLQIPPLKHPILPDHNHKADKFQLPQDPDLTDEDDLNDNDDDYEDDDYDDDDFEDEVPDKVMPFMGGAGAGSGGRGQIPNINMNAQKTAMDADNNSGRDVLMPKLINGNGGKKGGAPGEGNRSHDGEMGPVMKDVPHGFPNMGGHHLMPPAGMTAGGGARSMGSMNMAMAQMGNVQMSQMGSIPAVHKPPAAAMNGHGYFPRAAEPAEVMGRNPYQQQQYMMYSRPPPAVNYLPPYPYPPQPGIHNYSHYFSDESTSSCNLM